MRIRTTRQAQLIRAGVESALSPKRWERDNTKRDHPLTQHAFAVTIQRRNKPPAGVNGLTRRSHEDGGSITRVAKGPVLFAPVGTPIDDQTKWQNIGYLHDDGLPLSPGPERTNEWPPVHREFSFTITQIDKNAHRPYLKRFFGIYRLPGDKPLIHKGRKP